MADLGFLSDWISFCSKNHGPTCPKTKGGKGAKRISGFRLLDCETRSVMEASVNRAFVALSYVWGAPETAVDSIPWPPVVEDAIAVTKRLGYRYFWVDRYCINQNKSAGEAPADHKHARHLPSSPIHHSCSCWTRRDIW